MIKASIVTFREQLAKILGKVENGSEVEIQRHNITIARLIPVKQTGRNQTKLGSGKNTVKILGDILEPALPSKDWDMHQ